MMAGIWYTANIDSLLQFDMDAANILGIRKRVVAVSDKYKSVYTYFLIVMTLGIWPWSP